MIKRLKNFIVYVILVIVLVKSFQIIFFSNIIPVSKQDDLIEKVLYKEFDYGDYKTVRLLHTDTRRSGSSST